MGHGVEDASCSENNVIAAGCATLAFYGVVVNLVQWDFSKLLGVYVAFFATDQRSRWPAAFQGDRAEFHLAGIGLHRRRRVGDSVRPQLRTMIDGGLAYGDGG